MEKRWIIFQLLKVLEECDGKKINHGDIKTENVLLTSWNWVMLTDFASFKPTLLPDVRNTCVCYVKPVCKLVSQLERASNLCVSWCHN